ncbi:DUF5718 family protein [Vibrio mangrovi]|uniref:DUF5718 family protein n=1 Tax=Vibrio mangrovi TaxID=474394 RepID=A0A1Y6J146_9VIBR|nr:DUF5718 family protein [Vibrio mangrovi]MDW6005107.1 DUF5718 family protein [Vibrio mangrovi]SMS02971.1 hypothetical protein VIM7927_04333 [Vibrio mangrovi]
MVDLTQCIGLGVAGNFARHLEQAGEITDFLHIKAKEGAPKGIFPFYLPKSDSFLNVFPLSHQHQVIPDDGNPQVEPEVALYCELIYQEGKVTGINPLKFAAFNDCTIRKEGAKKISEKKNWGEQSKGVSATWIDLDKFSLGGKLDEYHLASFVKRDGQLHPYGVDTEVLGYSYFYDILLEWLVEKLNSQQDVGPLEDFAQILKDNHFPSHAIISIGATAYETFGEQNYLQSGDEITVIVYPKHIGNIREYVERGEQPEGASALVQIVA